MPILIPVILILGAGVGVVVALALASADRDLPVHEPELVIPPNASPAVKAQASGYDSRWNGKIYKLVDKILPLLKQASDSAQVPLGLLVGWIAKESGGKLGEVTRLDERGFFQIMNAESKGLGLDHARLSTDPTYSINGGLALIAKYMGMVDKLNVASRGGNYYWRLVKFFHSIGSGAAKKIVEMAQAAGEARTWDRLRSYALSHEKELMSLVKHSPTKWFGLTDEVARVGEPFGFGSQDTIVGGQVFKDITDPLDCLS